MKRSSYRVRKNGEDMSRENLLPDVHLHGRPQNFFKRGGQVHVTIHGGQKLFLRCFFAHLFNFQGASPQKFPKFLLFSHFPEPGGVTCPDA